VARPEEAAPADEMTMARAWLVHLGKSAISKLDGLDDAHLRAPSAGRLVLVPVNALRRY
jgi:hypothetical protein